MDETNQLLREIRDLLAQQEQKYQQHLVDVKKVYAEQLQMAEAERTKAIRTLSILGAIVGGAVIMALMFWR